jgi:adenosylcobinamide-GDP ribazoletransferase
LLDGLRLSLSLLTVFPVGRVPAADRSEGQLAMALAPVAGIAIWLPVGLISVLMRKWLSYDFGFYVPAVTCVAGIAVLTRGLHLDGLADVGDALASYRSPAAAREVMRRGDVGPLGVAAMVLVLLLQTALLEICIARHHGTVALLVALLAGRLAMTVSCLRGTVVAPDSTMGALVVGTVSRWTASLCTVLVMAVGALGAQLDHDTSDRGFETLQAVCAPLVVLAVLWPLRRHLVRRLGGINGDALGAQCELGFLVGVLVMAGKL